MKSKSREYKVTYLKNERKIAEISQKLVYLKWMQRIQNICESVFLFIPWRSAGVRKDIWEWPHIIW